MKERIESRELFVLDPAEGTVSGTYHRAYDEDSGAPSNTVEQKRIGILFLNSLTPTRSATGDSAVYWADSFAKHGYPSVRLDAAGFGDSAGDPPADPLAFMNTGGYATIAAGKISQVVERFNLEGVIIVGLCAGAVSALYAAAACKECKGVVLMDPYFHLPLTTAPGLWQKVVRRLSRTSIGWLVSSAYDRARAFRAQLPGTPPPSNANFSLLNCWKKVAVSGTPILLLKAQHTKLKIGDFDYLSYIIELAGPKGQVVVNVIEGTGHSFANRAGLDAVRQHTESWLNAYFPLMKRTKVNSDAVLSEPGSAQVRRICAHG